MYLQLGMIIELKVIGHKKVVNMQVYFSERLLNMLLDGVNMFVFYLYEVTPPGGAGGRSGFGRCLY